MTTFTKRVVAGGDDGYAYDSGTFNSNLAYFVIGHFDDASQQAFCRFTNVTIPKGATIVSAKVSLQAYSDYSATTCNVTVACEAADNPAAPTTKADLYGRSRTTGTAWSSISSWTNNSVYDTPDIAADVQEVVDRAGWASGQAMQVFFDDNSSSAAAFRAGDSYDGSSTTCALLTVEYSEAVSSGFFAFF